MPRTTLIPDSGSDHMPVKITLALTPDTIIRKKRPVWKIREEKITAWKEKVQPLTTLEDDIGAKAETFTKTDTPKTVMKMKIEVAAPIQE